MAMAININTLLSLFMDTKGIIMYHERGSVYTIRVNKDNPYNGVMGNEQTIYMILSIVWFALVGFYIMLLALERLM